MERNVEAKKSRTFLLDFQQHQTHDKMMKMLVENETGQCGRLGRLQKRRPNTYTHIVRGGKMKKIIPEKILRNGNDKRSSFRSSLTIN